MSIQVIRENAWEEKEGWRVSIHNHMNDYSNDVIEVWNKLILTDSPTFEPTRLPRDLKDDPDLTRLSIRTIMRMYMNYIDEIDNVVNDLEDSVRWGDTEEDVKLDRYINKHYSDIRFHEYINGWNTKTVYHLQEWYKQAYKSHTMLINWLKKNLFADDTNKILCMFRSKQAIMYYDLIRLEIHRRLCFPSVRTERVVETKKINQIPQHIKDLLITNMKEQNKTYDCPICMDTIQPEDIKFTGCGHMYCQGCLVRLKEQGKCAVCRESIE